MVLKTIDQKIIKAFSDASIQYDVLTQLHKEIGRELVNKIKDFESPSVIIDVGMGTGWLTNRMTHFFPEAKVVGLDFAPGMLHVAKKYNEGFGMVQADAARMPFKDNCVDIVISNLAYQWVADLDGAFKSCYKALKPKGVICFTLFGFHTLDELFLSLENSWDKKEGFSQLPIRRLPSQAQVQEALEQAGFTDVHIDYERITIHFPDMMALIKWIKNIGANALEKEMYVGKEWLARAQDYYNKNFKERFGVRSNFEVIWASGKKIIICVEL